MASFLLMSDENDIFSYYTVIIEFGSCFHSMNESNGTKDGDS